MLSFTSPLAAVARRVACTCLLIGCIQSNATAFQVVTVDMAIDTPADDSEVTSGSTFSVGGWATYGSNDYDNVLVELVPCDDDFIPTGNSVSSANPGMEYPVPNLLAPRRWSCQLQVPIQGPGTYKRYLVRAKLRKGNGNGPFVVTSEITVRCIVSGGP